MTGRVARLLIPLILAGPAGLVLAADPPTKPRHVKKTDAEWAKQLTREQFEVTRRKGTEAPFTNKYANNHARGVYACVCCGSELFSSRAKFESGTGWPSFFKPLPGAPIATTSDFKLGYERTEVECSTCDAHLGHVFDDGPPPTGLRYCMNSASLKFIPESKAKRAPAATPEPDAKPAEPTPTETTSP